MSFKPHGCLLTFKPATPGDWRGDYPRLVFNTAGFCCVANLLVLDNGVIHAYHETAETSDYVASDVQWMATLEGAYPPGEKSARDRFAQEFMGVDVAKGSDQSAVHVFRSTV